MTTTWKQLSRPLRVAIAAPWCLLAAFAAVAATPATRALLLDSANRPTADVSLTSAHWTGTLPEARLSAKVPLLDDSGNMSLPGDLNLPGMLSVGDTTIYADGTAAFDILIAFGEVATFNCVTRNIRSNNVPTASIDLSDPSVGYLLSDDAWILQWKPGGVDISTSLEVDGAVSLNQGTVHTQGTDGLGISGNLSVGGAADFDEGAISTDGFGLLSVVGLLVDAGGVGINSSIVNTSTERTVLDPYVGPVLYSPSGASWMLVVANDGTLSAVSY